MAHHGKGAIFGLLGAMGAGAAGLWYLAKRRATGAIVGTSSRVVRGKSGANWWIEVLQGAGGPATNAGQYRVYLAPPAEKGKAASALVPVLEYMQVGSNVNTRTLTKLFDQTAAAMNQAAIQDLGIATAAAKA